MQIQSAGVKKSGLIIDDDGRANVLASTQPEDRIVNKKNGKVWSVNFEAIAANATVLFAYVKNTGNTALYCTDIRCIARDANTVLWVQKVTGTVGGGTTITDITSRSLGATVAPSITAETATAATGLTGLTKTGNLFPISGKQDDMGHLRTTSNIIITPGSAIALYTLIANATNGIHGTFSLVEL